MSDIIIKSSIKSAIKTISEQKQAEIDKAVLASYEALKPELNTLEEEKLERLKEEEKKYNDTRAGVESYFNNKKSCKINEDKEAVTAVIGAKYSDAIGKLEGVLSELKIGE